MASAQRGRPWKYPVELRERAVRMVLEVRNESGQSFGVIARVAPSSCEDPSTGRGLDGSSVAR